MDDFHKAIKEGVVVVDFTASWCGPCRIIAPHFEELAKQYEGKVKCFKVDVDENSDAAAEASVRAMPTFKVYKDGSAVDEMLGADKDKLAALFAKHAA